METGRETERADVCARSVMVTVVGNEHREASSKPGRSCLYLI